MAALNRTIGKDEVRQQPSGRLAIGQPKRSCEHPPPRQAAYPASAHDCSLAHVRFGSKADTSYLAERGSAYGRWPAHSGRPEWALSRRRATHERTTATRHFPPESCRSACHQTRTLAGRSQPPASTSFEIHQDFGQVSVLEEPIPVSGLPSTLSLARCTNHFDQLGILLVA